ncbi:MAG: general stress protein, partial [Ktedonobacterales bacterium]
MARSIAGLFPDRASAEQAIADLKSAGFDSNHMGIVLRDRQETREVASDQGINSTTGAVTGSAIGGTAGAILAATGAFVIPGIGPFISGGILATALAGGAAGWLIGGLVGLGIPHEEARYYQGRVEQGSTLLTVDAPGREMEAQQIMLNNGAEDLRAQGYGYSGAATGPTTTPAAPN